MIWNEKGEIELRVSFNASRNNLLDYADEVKKEIEDRYPDLECYYYDIYSSIGPTHDYSIVLSYRSKS